MTEKEKFSHRARKVWEGAYVAHVGKYGAGEVKNHFDVVEFNNIVVLHGKENMDRDIHDLDGLKPTGVDSSLRQDYRLIFDKV